MNLLIVKIYLKIIIKIIKKKCQQFSRSSLLNKINKTESQSFKKVKRKVKKRLNLKIIIKNNLLSKKIKKDDKLKLLIF